MKFIVHYRTEAHDQYGRLKHVYRNKTIQANEINEAIRNFITATRLSVFTHVTTVRQGRSLYQWHGIARDAFPANYKF